nr:hypothetical protein [uncultured Draconibacterium sp.]
MKKKKNFNFLLLLFILMIAANGKLLYNIAKQNETLNSLSTELKRTKQNIDKSKEYFLKRDFRCNSSAGLYISDTIKVKGHKNNYYYLKDLVEDPFCLVFYIDKSHCTTCVEEEVKRLKGYFEELHSSKILLLFSNIQDRDIEYFKLSNQINFKTFQIAPNALNLPIIDYEIPFLFALNTNGLVYSVFIPDLYEKDFSNAYYSHIEELFFNQ